MNIMTICSEFEEIELLLRPWNFEVFRFWGKNRLMEMVEEGVR